MANIVKLGFFKVHMDVSTPKVGTQESACWDIAYSKLGKAAISGHDHLNNIISNVIDPKGSFVIRPLERLLVPTGLILNIPEGYSVRIHPRGGLSIRCGLSLANCEGVVDSDYVEEVFLPIINYSNTFQTIVDGTRLAQFELVKNLSFELYEENQKPKQKTDRNGGFSSTGIT